MAASIATHLAKFFVFPLVAGVALLYPQTLLPAAPRQSRHLLPPHSPSDAQRVLIASPDRLYEARITGGDATPSYLYIYKVMGKHRRLILPRVVDAQSFIWVPKHPHLLAVAAGSGTEDFQAAQLSLWDGGKLREMVPVRDRGLEGFDLEGATADGKILVYDHSTADDVLVNQRFKLPSP